jgi:hypothetical protein
MGMLDHQRTWTIDTSLSPEECVTAFVDALTGKNISLMGTKWKVHRTGAGQAVATYQGRSGVMAGVTAMSSRASSEQDAAIGSTMAFSAAQRGGRTRCEMQMTSVGKIMLFFTADARFFRSAMNRVEGQLRALDRAMVTEKV